MKLGYELDAAQRAALEAQQIALAKPAKMHAAVVKKVTYLRGIETKVLATIRELEERADGSDEKLVTKLAGKRQQLLLLRASIGRGEYELGSEFLLFVQRAAHQAHKALRPILLPMSELHQKQIVSLLLPFCENEAQAQVIARSHIPSLNYVLHFVGGETLRGSLRDIDSALAAVEEKKALVGRLLEGAEILPDYADFQAAARALKARQASGRRLSPSPIAPEILSHQPDGLSAADHASRKAER